MILFVGVVGAGKSVQGKYLSELLGFPWISTGEILRENITGELKEKMHRGDLLSDEDLYEVVKPILTNLIKQTNLILDGFPRTRPQAEWLQDFVEANNTSIDCIIHLEAEEDEVIDRLLKRGRPDDTREVIKNRFNEYRTKTMPILSYFEDKGIPVLDIDGNGTEEEVRNRISKTVTHIDIKKS
jgi:adenylate kinase